MGAAASLTTMRGRRAKRTPPGRAWLVIGLLFSLLGVLLHHQATADHATSADLSLPPPVTAPVDVDPVLPAEEPPAQGVAEASSLGSDIPEAACGGGCEPPGLLVACALLIVLVAAVWRLRAPYRPRLIPPLGVAAPTRVPVRHQWWSVPSLTVLAISRT